MIEFHEIDIDIPKFDLEKFQSALDNIVTNEGLINGDINIVVCSDEHLLEMNQRHLNHDYYTDIITFDYTEEKIVSGDLYISLDRVAENALLHNTSLLNEFARVCAHGVLHLCGYMDKSANDIVTMRAKEEEYLPLFGST